MARRIKKIIILGGGSAGWLTAGMLASRYKLGADSIKVTLLESPDVKTIGVGEGTWPSMRTTLQTIGISESEFIKTCDVSFKQGTCFIDWLQQGHRYYHPFSQPEGFADFNLASDWQQYKDQVSFTDAVCSQGKLCDLNLAPKQMTTPEYAFNANYGYHLNALKFAKLLQTHCVEKLAVEYIQCHVDQVCNDNQGYIESVKTSQGKEITGDLFVDCSGLSARLIGQHYQVKEHSVRDYLFNNRACVAQIPYQNPDDEIASYTASTAQEKGWIWDIGLSSRRGVGYVYSSDYCTEDEAELAVKRYAKKINPQAQIQCRTISFEPAYKEQFWHKNCVAIGLSAGFVEPLEASALVLIELSAKMLVEQLPTDFETMSVVAKRFNRKFSYRWQQITDFLKLHYVLSQRQGAYWQDHKQPATLSENLRELLVLWKTQPPWHQDTPYIDELFSSASFQYVLYGMGFETKSVILKDNEQTQKKAQSLFESNIEKTNKLTSIMPGNRELINKICQYGLQKI